MKTVNSTAFSDTLNNRIAEPEIAIDNLHPGNIQSMPPMSIQKNEKAGDGPQPWDDNADLNGFSLSKINAMIRELKIGKTKIIALIGRVNIDKVNFRHEVPVPSEYDGRDAFVSFSYIASLSNSYPSSSQRQWKAWSTCNEREVVFEFDNCWNAQTQMVPSFQYLIVLRRFL